jgi:ribonuclease HII
VENCRVSRDLAAYDDEVRREGFSFLCGVDEAGRGPLAGPVVASAVILREDRGIPGLDDSKKLSAPRRAGLEIEIRAHALAFGVGVAGVEEIERLNILKASLLAMERAVTAIAAPPDFILPSLLLVDGIHRIGSPIPQRTVVKGDAVSACVAAASILAKEHRDRLMRGYADEYPGYGFESHMGYGTSEHRAAIERLGPCPLHRKTFRGVKEYLPAAPRNGCLSLF